MDHFLFGDQNTFPNIIYKPDIMTRGKTNSKKNSIPDYPRVVLNLEIILERSAC